MITKVIQIRVAMTRTKNVNSRRRQGGGGKFANSDVENPTRSNDDSTMMVSSNPRIGRLMYRTYTCYISYDVCWVYAQIVERRNTFEMWELRPSLCKIGDRGLLRGVCLSEQCPARGEDSIDDA
jgi:hypothetical protein